MRRALLLSAKAAISILLLYFSLRWGNVSAIAGRLSRLEPGWMALALGLLTTQIVFLAIRWKTIAVACGANLAFVPALQFSFIAAFFNQVLPSTVGGDGARIWLLARRGAAGWARATYSVLIDRIVGVFAVALVVLVCLPWTFELIHDAIARTVLLMIGFGATIGALVFVFIGARFQKSFDRWALTRHLAGAARVAATLCGSLHSFAFVMACSIAFHLITIAAAWCCVKAIAAPVSFLQVLFLMPPVLLVSTVPISIAGWGVRETSMIAAFGVAGLAQGDGLTLSILFGAASFAVGVIGGIVWIASGLRIRSFAPTVAEAKAVGDNP
ncbi:MAG: lysylphosphatidylglycerol synthase transmembrane domain-containing protein [Pseudolabrys sp.]